MEKEYIMIEAGLLEMLCRAWAIKKGIASVAWTFNARMTTDSRVYLKNTREFWEEIPKIAEEIGCSEFRIQEIDRDQIPESFLPYLDADLNVALEGNSQEKEEMPDSMGWAFRSLSDLGELISQKLGVPFQKTVFWVRPWTEDEGRRRRPGENYALKLGVKK